MITFTKNRERIWWLLGSLLFVALGVVAYNWIGGIDGALFLVWLIVVAIMHSFNRPITGSVERSVYIQKRILYLSGTFFILYGSYTILTTGSLIDLLIWLVMGVTILIFTARGPWDLYRDHFRQGDS